MTTPNFNWVNLKLEDIRRCTETIIKYITNTHEKPASLLISVAFLLVRCGDALDVDLKHSNPTLESVLKTHIHPMLQRFYDQNNATLGQIDSEQSRLLIQPFWTVDVMYDDIEVAMINAIEYLVAQIVIICNVKTIDYDQCVAAACLILCSFDMSRKFSAFKPEPRDYQVAVKQMSYIMRILADQKSWDLRKEQLAKMNYICRTSTITNNRVRGFATMKKLI